MKSLFLLVLFAPLFSLSQDCILKKEKDQFSQLPKLTSGFIKFDADVPFQLSVDATKPEIIFFFVLKNSGDAKCFDDASTIVMNYENNRSKATLRNTSTMNCEGYFHLAFRNSATTHSTLNRMVTQKLSSISFINGKIITVVNLDEKQRAALQNMAACIAREAKTLLTP